MKRTLLSILAVFLAFVCTENLSAQTSAPKGRLNSSELKSFTLPRQNPVRKVQKIDAADNQAWIGYWDEGSIAAIGMGMACDYNLAIYIPAGFTKADATLDAVRFMLYGNNVSDMTVWASTTLPDTPAEANLAAKKVDADSYMPLELCDVAFDQAITIPAEGVYVGVSFNVTQLETDGDAYPMIVSQIQETISGSCFYKIMSDYDPNWYDDSSYGMQLAISALVGGEFYGNAASASPFATRYLTAGQTAKVPVKVTNNGKEPISKLKYTVTSNGNTSAEKSALLLQPIAAMGGSAYITVSLAASENPEAATHEITVTQVNGVENENTNSKAGGTIVTIDQSVQNVPLMEEYTGMWCGWCPRGAVALGLIEVEYPDVITMAVHNGDILQNYKYDFSGVDGFPSAVVNRGEMIDPYYDYTSGIESALKAVTPASLGLKACWVDDTHSSIRLEASSTFRFNSTTTAPYGITYFLVENGMTGSGEDWLQANYFSGAHSDYADDPNLLPLCDMPEYINGMVYDHVMVDVWDCTYGMDGSVKAPIVLGEAQTHTCTLDISGNEFIQNKENLTLVAALIDRTSGKVLNAAKAKIDVPGTLAVDKVNGTTAIAGRYSIDGRQVGKSHKGITILRMSDGSHKKVLLK